jgi:hypothetical protein
MCIYEDPKLSYSRDAGSEEGQTKRADVTRASSQECHLVEVFVRTLLVSHILGPTLRCLRTVRHFYEKHEPFL